MAVHDIWSPALGLFTDVNKANGRYFIPFSELGLRSSFTIQCLSIHIVFSQGELREKSEFQVS